MSEAQSIAAKEAWARRREQQAALAAAEANAAAEAIPDEAIEALKADNTLVEPEEVKPLPKPDHSGRLALLAEVAEARKKGLPGPNEFEPTHEEPPPDEAPAASTPAEPAAAPVVPSAPELVEAKVNGQTFMVPKAEVEADGGLATYQIKKAAEQTLQEAKELKRKTLEEAQQLRAFLQTQAQAPKKAPDEVLKENIPKIQFGTPEEAAQAWLEIEKAKAQPAIDPLRLQQDTVSAVFEHMAANDFIKRNQDILQDPLVKNLAVLAQSDMIRSEGKPQDWNEFYGKLEVKLRSVLGKPTIAPKTDAAPIQPTSGSVADKEARKASIVALPVTAARAAAPEEPKPKTREDLLAAMRKSRGQVV